MSDNDKYNRVINNNTFWFSDTDFEQENETYIESLKTAMLDLSNQINASGVTQDIINNLLKKNDIG